VQIRGVDVLGRILILSMADEFLIGLDSKYKEKDMENGGVGDATYLYNGKTFIWDRDKNNKNVEKHFFNFMLAASVYEDSYKRTVDQKDPRSGQVRHLVYGHPDGYENFPLLVVVDFRPDKDKIRIISSQIVENDYDIEKYNARKKTIIGESLQNKRNVDYLVSIMDKTF